MRDGKPCGFMMISGQMPRSEKGMSSCATIRPMTPFCPCREENLSPSSGLRVDRTRSLIRWVSFLLPDNRTRSTYVSPWPTGPLYVSGVGRNAEEGRSCETPWASSRVLVGVILLTSTSPDMSRSPTPQMPSSSMTRYFCNWGGTALGLAGCPGAAGAVAGGSGLGSVRSDAPLGNFLSGQVNFLSTMHRPSPRSSEAELSISASSIS
mmetsp:Transcript_29596/g.95622  ORF Transcript_29596/g.95622 Transcript_29596/m.95622 type:complete len:208 (-) Transcript_29596:2340-2963(-)